MGRVSVTQDIARTPAEVHAFISDFDRYPEWIPFTKEVTSVERKPGVVGTVYTERGTGGKSRWEVVEYQRGAREVHEGDIGIARVRIEMTMRPSGNGTSYEHVIEYKMKVPVLGWVLEKAVLGPQMRKGTHEMVGNLKRILEGGNCGPAGRSLALPRFTGRCRCPLMESCGMHDLYRRRRTTYTCDQFFRRVHGVSEWKGGGRPF